MNNSTRNKLVVIFSILLFCIIAAIALIVALNLDLNKIEHNTPAASDTVSTVISEVVSEETASEASTENAALSGKADSAYISKSLFIGDFVPAAMKAYGLIGKKRVVADVNAGLSNIADRNITVNGKTTTSLKAIEAQQPENIYISIGSNDVSWRTQDSTAEAYTAYVNAVRKAAPEADIYLMAVTPVTAACDGSGSPYTNDRVDKFNSWIQAISEEANVYYLDINAALKGDDDTLPNEFAESDGYHLKSAACEMVRDYILSHTAE